MEADDGVRDSISVRTSLPQSCRSSGISRARVVVSATDAAAVAARAELRADLSAELSSTLIPWVLAWLVGACIAIAYAKRHFFQFVVNERSLRSECCTFY